jgi:hypothetical protein
LLSTGIGVVSVIAAENSPGTAGYPLPAINKNFLLTIVVNWVGRR